MPIYATGKKKEGKQQYRVRINYTEAGEYRQKEQICYGYHEALALEKHLRNLYAADGNRGDIPLRDYFEEYLRQRKADVRETTLEKLRSNMENHILPVLGDVPLSELTPQLIAQWKTAVAEKGLGGSYSRRIYSSLNALLNYAVRMGLIHENPMNKVGNFREVNFKAPEEQLHYYTPEQFLRYAEAANQSVKSYYDRSIYMFMMIAYYTGMRKGEIHALRWEDIDGNVIRVHRSITQKVKGKTTVETPPKNRCSIRTLQIPAPLLQLLKEYRALQWLQYRGRWSPKYRVILGERCVSDTALANHNIAWAKAAGLDPIRIHDFRHSHASLLANEGINIQEIARRLGHSNVQITWRTYSHLYPREEERAVTVLNKVVIPDFATNN